MAWLDSARVWQLQRRSGYDLELQALAKESPAVRALFDALVELLTRGGRKH